MCITIHHSLYFSRNHALLSFLSEVTTTYCAIRKWTDVSPLAFIEVPMLSLVVIKDVLHHCISIGRHLFRVRRMGNLV